MLLLRVSFLLPCYSLVGSVFLGFAGSNTEIKYFTWRQLFILGWAICRSLKQQQYEYRGKESGESPAFPASSVSICYIVQKHHLFFQLTARGARECVYACICVYVFMVLYRCVCVCVREIVPLFPSYALGTMISVEIKCPFLMLELEPRSEQENGPWKLKGNTGNPNQIPNPRVVLGKP